MQLIKRILKISVTSISVTVYFTLSYSLHGVWAYSPPEKNLSDVNYKNLNQLLAKKTKQNLKRKQPSLIFDLPITYNKKVNYWIEYYQTKGRKWFSSWLERSTKYMPSIQKELNSVGMPQDLAFLAMVESGFNLNATSEATAVGPWQFIEATALRYGLKINWWLDERRDLHKSTLAAIKYIKDLHTEFGSWYLVAASYNMGENGLRKKIQKYRTKDFWQLCSLEALPQETVDYVPKILAAMMISKSPHLYGFREITHLDPLEYDVVVAPGNLHLDDLADFMGITRKAIKDLNAEITLGYIPASVRKHPIRIPRGAVKVFSAFLTKWSQDDQNNESDFL